MPTFAPDAEQDLALFKENTIAQARRERATMAAWLADHLRLGGVVYEHYQENNAVRWTIQGTHRIIAGRPLPNGFRVTADTSPDQNPEYLAEKLLRRSFRWGVTLTYAKTW